MGAVSIILMIVCLGGVWGTLIWSLFRTVKLQKQQGNDTAD